MADLLTAGFTASRDLDERGEGVVVNVLCQLRAARYVTGGCVGGDAFIGRWLALNRPDAEHVVVVPADRSRVDPWWLEPVVRCSALVEVTEMPPGTTYRDRNARLVGESAMFCGFPAYEEDDPRSLRSGSWQALRMSRRAGNLCRWDCVKPPYHGRVERWPSKFARSPRDATATPRGENGP